jgi:hypothetical protein
LGANQCVDFRQAGALEANSQSRRDNAAMPLDSQVHIAWRHLFETLRATLRKLSQARSKGDMSGRPLRVFRFSVVALVSAVENDPEIPIVLRLRPRVGNDGVPQAHLVPDGAQIGKDPLHALVVVGGGREALGESRSEQPTPRLGVTIL